MDAQIAALAADPEIKDLLDVNYMRFEQRDEHERDIAEVESVLSDPARRKQVQNPGRLVQQTAQRKRNLLLQTPPPLTPSQRTKIDRLEKLAQAAFTDGMPTQEEMRHRPPGAVDHHMSWERDNKRAIVIWKRCRLLNNPQSRERDLCNIERFRPSVQTRSFMTDAQISRSQPVSASDLGRANYDQINWDSPEVAQALQKLIDEGKIKINRGVRRGALRPPKGSGKVYECKDQSCPEFGRIFSGGWAKKNLDRHNAGHGQLVGATA